MGIPEEVELKGQIFEWWLPKFDEKHASTHPGISTNSMQETPRDLVIMATLELKFSPLLRYYWFLLVDSWSSPLVTFPSYFAKFVCIPCWVWSLKFMFHAIWWPASSLTDLLKCLAPKGEGGSLLKSRQTASSPKGSHRLTKTCNPKFLEPSYQRAAVSPFIKHSPSSFNCLIKVQILK